MTEYTEAEIQQALNEAVEDGLLTLFIEDGEIFYVKSEEMPK